MIGGVCDVMWVGENVWRRGVWVKGDEVSLKGWWWEIFNGFK